MHLPWLRNATLVQDLAKLTQKQQMRLLRDTAVCVGSIGGGSYVTMYMPPGSTSVRVSQTFPAMESPFFDWMPTMQVHHRQKETPCWNMALLLATDVF